MVWPRFSIELILWGILPSVIALGALALSVRISLQTQRVMQWLATVICLLSTLWSGMVLFNIFLRNAWPTYLPHLVIGGMCIIVMLQWIAGKVFGNSSYREIRK